MNYLRKKFQDLAQKWPFGCRNVSISKKTQKNINFRLLTRTNGLTEIKKKVNCSKGLQGPQFKSFHWSTEDWHCVVLDARFKDSCGHDLRERSKKNNTVVFWVDQFLFPVHWSNICCQSCSWTWSGDLCGLCGISVECCYQVSHHPAAKDTTFTVPWRLYLLPQIMTMLVAINN